MIHLCVYNVSKYMSKSKACSLVNIIARKHLSLGCEQMWVCSNTSDVLVLTAASVITEASTVAERAMQGKKVLGSSSPCH